MLKLFRNTLFISLLITISTLTWAGIFFAGLALTTTPNSLKNAIASSGIYETAPQLISSKILGGKQPQSKEAIMTSLNRLLPPDRLQNDTEAIIAQTFLWLRGKSDSPVPTIQIVSTPQELVTLFNLVIQEHTYNLYPCNQKELSTISSLPLHCRPTSMLSIDQIVQLIQMQGTSSSSIKKLFNEGIISPEILRIQPETTTKIQRIYFIYKNMPLILLGSIILSIALAYFLRPKLHFFKAIGAALSIPPSLHILSGLAGLGQYKDLIANTGLYAGENAASPLAQKVLHEFLKPLIHTFLTNIIYTSVAILAIGSALIIRDIKRKKKSFSNLSVQPQTQKQKKEA